MNWKLRIPLDIREKINIDIAAEDFRNKIRAQREKGFQSRTALTRARQLMVKRLMTRGLSCQEAVWFLHYTEIEPYNGCGCCEHRKPNNKY